MANIKYCFLGTEKSRTSECEMKCYANSQDEIFLSITDENLLESYICLDESTAIKLAKTLRTEINKIK